MPFLDVIIKGTKDARAYEKSEDPLYVLENNVPIDTKYYLENQLSKPLMRIFEPILGEKANSLRAPPRRPIVELELTLSRFAVSGDHTRTVSIVAPTIGGLMKFAVRTVTCLGCKTPLKAGSLSRLRSPRARRALTLSFADNAVCSNCRPRTAELHAKQLATSAMNETAFARLWTQCQRCQGSLHLVRLLLAVD